MFNKFYTLLFLSVYSLPFHLPRIIHHENKDETSFLDVKNNIYVCYYKHDGFYIAHFLDPRTQQINMKFEGEPARRLFKDIELAYNLPKARL